MTKRMCKIGLLAFLAVQWYTLALSQEQPNRAELTNLLRVAGLQIEAQDSAAASNLAAGDTVKILPGNTKAFTEIVNGCPVLTPSAYNVQTELPSFVTFNDKGVEHDRTLNRFIISFDLAVDGSASAGFHDVKLTYQFLITGGGVICTRVLTYVIDTNPILPPIADFTGNPLSGSKPLTVQFTDRSTGQITSRSWNFGDGQTSTLTNPSHTYVNSGSYTVSLTVTGPGGSNTKTRTNYITVIEPPPPVADFTGSPVSGVKPLTVQFTDASTGQITSRSWNFGDGQTSAATNPSHTYNNAGTYTVSLTVTGPGGSNTKTRTNYITVTEPPPPVADFTGSPASGMKPLTVQFTDASTGQITSRSWNFGDGQTSTATNPSHAYVNSGSYTVSLTVTGPGGSNTKTRTNYITVTEPPPPVADFTGSPTSGVKPLTVQFTDASTGQISSRSWNFGDGQTSTATNPSHAYVNSGSYTVSLTVTGPGGSNTKTRTNYITVTEPPPPVADFTGSPASGVKPLTVQFTDASTGQITSRSWNFGDGQTSTATNPSHAYVNSGSYTVSLTITGPGGSNTKTRTNYITVTEPPPVANFTGSPASGVKPLSVQFTDASTGQITSRLWNFGEGQTSTETNPSHTYVNAGVYTVSLIVTGPGGSNTKTRENFITVQEPSLNPPRNLVAHGLPGKVSLSWEPPATAKPDTSEISYDDGTSEAGIRGNFSGAELAVRFTPTSYPVNLFALRFLAVGNANNDKYGVKVYLDPAASNSGPVGSPVFDGSVSFSAPGTIGANFSTPVTITSGDFYISLYYISGSTVDFNLGLDKSTDARRSWLRSGSTFVLSGDLGFPGNFVIRALVVRSASGSMMAATGLSIGEERDGGEGRRDPHMDYPIIQRLTATPNVLFGSSDYSLSSFISAASKTIVYPAKGGAVSPRAMLQGYNIYRSTSSPVQVVAQNKINSVNASTTNFDDTNVIGGTTYYYVVTAVYDEGESGPSNEIFAIPQTQTKPTITLNPTSFQFLATPGGGNPPSQALSIHNTGVPGSTLNWTAAANATWLTVSPTSGALAAGASQNVTLSINITNLAVGAHNATVTISDPNANNSPQTATVQLTITPPSRLIRVVNASASPGSAVSLAIELVAQGDENALGFSLTFDAAIVGNPQAARGKDAGAATFNTNDSQKNQGRYGIALALSSGQKFSAGTREIVVLSFIINPNTSAASTVIGFSDQPINREVVDQNAGALPAAWIAGTVTITGGFEADVAPRPHGNNNGTATIADWVQVGRFVAHLDTPRVDINEFQRADCAPKSCGDGRLGIADWVQAGRYAAGFDTVVAACGPLTPTSSIAVAGNVGGSNINANDKAAGSRTVRVVDATFKRGQMDSIVVALDAQGDENALGFSLNFDQNLLTFKQAKLGNGATGATLNVNGSQTADGRIGIALALPTGQKFAAGTRQIVIVLFSVNSNPSTTSTMIGFGDQPITREMVDVSANALSTIWTPGTIMIENPTSVKESANGTPAAFELEQNYPNPSNPSTTIAFTIPRSCEVTLKVFNTKGEEVATLMAEQLPPGRYQRQWNASGFASGLYFYRLQAGEFVATRKLVVLK